MRAAIIAYQGGVEEHAHMLRRAAEEEGVGLQLVYAKRPGDLAGVSAVVLPGGESTTIGRLLERTGTLPVLRRLIEEEGVAVMGTCAGAALLAKRVKDRVVGETGQPLLGVMSIAVTRNYYGRQRDSFEAPVELRDPTGLAPELEEKPFPAVFIRAPAITEAWGGATVMGSYGGAGAAAVEEGMLALAFHPELTSDTRLHRLLLRLAKR